MLATRASRGVQCVATGDRRRRVSAPVASRSWRARSARSGDPDSVGEVKPFAQRLARVGSCPMRRRAARSRWRAGRVLAVRRSVRVGRLPTFRQVDSVCCCSTRARPRSAMPSGPVAGRVVPRVSPLLGFQLAGVFVVEPCMVSAERDTGAPGYQTRFLTATRQPAAAHEQVVTASSSPALSDSQPRAGGTDRLQQEVIGVGGSGPGRLAVGLVQASLLDQNLDPGRICVLRGMSARPGHGLRPSVRSPRRYATSARLAEAMPKPRTDPRSRHLPAPWSSQSRARSKRSASHRVQLAGRTVASQIPLRETVARRRARVGRVARDLSRRPDCSGVPGEIVEPPRIAPIQQFPLGEVGQQQPVARARRCSRS